MALQGFNPAKRAKTSGSEREFENYSELERARLAFPVPVPAVLEGTFEIREGAATSAARNPDQIKELFPNLFGQPGVSFVSTGEAGSKSVAHKPLHIGCVLSGGQASGGHNCICGIFDYVQRNAPGSKVFGFLGGPKGIMDGKFRVLDPEFVDKYRNTGGFDMLASGRDKIETPEQFAMARATAEKNELDGIVVIGGDDSNTNAALLAENFKANGLHCKVLGLPKTIDGDLKNEYVETSFGFDTAAKVYAEYVGNVQTDCVSTEKYYHFCRIMGREASHLALEVALQTRPNMCFIGEEVKANNLSLRQVTDQIADMVCARAAKGLMHGVVLIPEGLIDFVPEVSSLIAQINDFLGHGGDPSALSGALTDANRAIFDYLPAAIRAQLLLDRDPHGNVQVAKIETERLFQLLTEKELQVRKAAGTYQGKFEVQHHYFGYEGRCSPPTDFDCYYCYALGLTAGALLGKGHTGMIASIRGLHKPVQEWTVGGMPLTHMMNVERRKGKDKPVIKKALTELEGEPFKAFCAHRESWKMTDHYRNPGPIQYGTGIDEATFTLRCEQLGAEKVKEALQAPGKLKGRRVAFVPELPSSLEGGFERHILKGEVPSGDAVIMQALVHTGLRPVVDIQKGEKSSQRCKDLRIGVCFSGRQTPGGHSAILGIRKFLDLHGGANSKVLGFVGGTKGLFAGTTKEITSDVAAEFANTGGFEMLGRTADVIRGPAHIEAVAKTCTDLSLDGLCIVGGPISMCDAALLAEELVKKDVKTEVIGLPGTIDGDLKGGFVEAAFGFDTSCKVYSSIIGSLQTDAASARKYYYFIRLMGRSPSQVALECGLQTQPNAVLLGEEFEAERKTLADIIGELADMVMERAALGKNFGIVLIPEGLVEYVPELRTLLREVSDLMARGHKGEEVEARLSPWAKAMFTSLPGAIKEQVLLEQEVSTGSARLAQIETERLLAELVAEELERRKALPGCAYKGGFSPVCFFLGYQARSSFPSKFDCNLAHALGATAAALVAAPEQFSGYMANARGLCRQPSEWRCGGIPISMRLTTSRRGGQSVAVMPPTTVDLHGNSYMTLTERRKDWRLGDCYRNPGPVQFDGPVGEITAKSLWSDHAEMEEKRQQVSDLLEKLRTSVLGGSGSTGTLDAAITGLQSLSDIIALVQKSAGSARKSTAQGP